MQSPKLGEKKKKKKKQWQSEKKNKKNINGRHIPGML